MDLVVLLEQDGDLIAIAVPPTADTDAIVDYILKGKREGFGERKMATSLNKADGLILATDQRRRALVQL